MRSLGPPKKFKEAVLAKLPEYIRLLGPGVCTFTGYQFLNRGSSCGRG